MYKVFKGVYSIKDTQREFLQVVNCNLKDSDSYLYIGYYKLKFEDRVDIYINNEANMFLFSYNVLNKNPLSYIDLFNLINLFNTAVGDDISCFVGKKSNIIFNLQANSNNNLLYRLGQALLFYDDYIDLDIT